jgi:hypothetical protein
MAMGTTIKLVLLIKDKFGDLSFHFFSCHFVERGIAKKAPGKERVLIKSNDALIKKFFELKGRLVLLDLNDAVFLRVANQFFVPGQDDSLLLTSQLDQFMSVLSAVVGSVITQHSQLFGQFPKHDVDKKLHDPLILYLFASGMSKGVGRPVLPLRDISK